MSLIKRSMLVSWVAVSVFGCSGGNDAPSPAEPVPAPQPLPPVPDTIAPDATIVFPASVSKTDAATITVKGFSNDENQVSRITVNGENATLTPDEENQTTYWSVTIPVEQTITVETEDSEGNIELIAATASIVEGEVPLNFAVDNTNYKVVGWLPRSGELVVKDVITGEQILPAWSLPFSGRPSFLIHISAENKVAAIGGFNGEFHLAIADPQSYEFNSVIEYTVPKSHLDWTYAQVGDVDYDPVANALFVNFQMDYVGASGKSHIIQYDFDTNELTVLVDGVDTQGNDVAAKNIAYSNSALYFYPYLNDLGLHKLSLDTLAVEKLNSDGPNSARYLQSNSSDPNSIIGINSDDVFNFDTLSGEYSSISKQVDQHDIPLSLSEWHGSGIDEYNNQILIKEADLDLIVGIELGSGKRSRFFYSGVGEGKAIIDPWALALDQERNQIYVFDSGINAPETIMAIDMVTGNRAEVGHVNRSANRETNSLVLDQEANLLYAIFPQEIAVVDIDTNTTQELTGGEIGGGIDVNWMDNGVLDKTNNRLLVVDNYRIVAVDLSNGSRSLMSSAEDNVGTGESFGRIGGLAMNSLGTQLIATGLDGENPELFDVDLITGNRALMNDVCTGLPEYSDILSYDTYYPYHPVVMNATGSKLYLFGKQVITVDLKTNDCKSDDIDYGRDVARNNVGQWFTVGPNDLIQFDVETNERVIVSK